MAAGFGIDPDRFMTALALPVLPADSGSKRRGADLFINKNLARYWPIAIIRRACHDGFESAFATSTYLTS